MQSRKQFINPRIFCLIMKLFKVYILSSGSQALFFKKVNGVKFNDFSTDIYLEFPNIGILT